MEIRVFDRGKLLKNISTIIQERGVKIGELETSVGVSPGYLSRLSKEDVKTLPSLDVVWRIAKALNVNMERLVEGNFDHESNTVAYMQQFLQKLFSDTVNGSISWSSMSIATINEILRNELREYVAFIQYDRNHDYTDNWEIRKQLHYTKGTSSGYENNRIAPVTSPRTNPWVDDSVFHTVMPDGRTLFLVKYGEIHYSDDNQPSINCFYELFFDVPDCQDDAIIPIFNTLGNRKDLLPDIEKLYQELKEHEFDLRISQDALSSIDRFMGKAVPQSNGFIQVDDDELPF